MVCLRRIIDSTPVSADIGPIEVDWTDILGCQKRLQLEVSPTRDRLADVVQTVTGELGMPLVSARGDHLFAHDVETAQRVEHSHRVWLVVRAQTDGVRVGDDGFPLCYTVWRGEVKAL